MSVSMPGSDQGAAQSGRSRLRILIADDEAMIRRALRRLLERRGHTVDAVEDTATALARLGEAEFDVILLDVHMPGNGRTLLEALLEGDFPGRIVLMTGGVPEDVAPEAPDTVLRVQKPFDFDALARMVEGKDESTS